MNEIFIFDKNSFDQFFFRNNGFFSFQLLNIFNSFEKYYSKFYHYPINDLYNNSYSESFDFNVILDFDQAYFNTHDFPFFPLEVFSRKSIIILVSSKEKESFRFLLSSFKKVHYLKLKKTSEKKRIIHSNLFLEFVAIKLLRSSVNLVTWKNKDFILIDSFKMKKLNQKEKQCNYLNNKKVIMLKTRKNIGFLQIIKTLLIIIRLKISTVRWI